MSYPTKDAAFYAWWLEHRGGEIEPFQFRITATQIKNLLAAPVQLLPKPGAGFFWHVFIVPIFLYKFGSVPFANVGATSLVVYNKTIVLGSGMAQAVPAAGLIDAGADTLLRALPAFTPSLLSNIEDTEVFLSQDNSGATGEYTNGDGELWIHCEFHRVMIL